MKSKAFLLLAAMAVALPVVPASADGMPGCAEAGHAGGEWPRYGNDLGNTRSQPLETTIGVDNARDLEPKWTINLDEDVPGGAGVIQNTPVVSDGCVYVSTSGGFVLAINADSGEILWGQYLAGAGGGLLIGGVIVGSPTVADGIVYAAVSRPGSPYVTAMDQATGDILWSSTVMTTDDFDAVFNAAPVVFDGLIFQGWLGVEGSGPTRGGYAILDASGACSAADHLVCPAETTGATGGSIIESRWTITDEEYADGYHGASVWCTAAVDPDAKAAYACGGNPHSEGKEARLANSMFKVDLDRASDTFGDITDYYKGRTDQYVAGADRQLVCENFADETTVAVWSLGCLMLDLDFGASPNLWKDEQGRTIVGNLQKAGVYHAFYGDHLTPAWQTTVSVPCFFCNATSGAVADGSVITVGSPVGQVVSIEAQGRNAGNHEWVSPTNDVIHYQSVSYANGVAYVIDSAGSLIMLDAATGLPLMRRPMALDVGGSTHDLASQGVAIARNRVFAASATYVIAYGLPA